MLFPLPARLEAEASSFPLKGREPTLLRRLYSRLLSNVEQVQRVGETLSLMNSVISDRWRPCLHAESLRPTRTAPLEKQC